MNKSRGSRGESSRVPVVRSGADSDGDDAALDMAGFARELVSRARSQGVELNRTRNGPSPAIGSRRPVTR
jgi:hypothetical protein